MQGAAGPDRRRPRAHWPSVLTCALLLVLALGLLPGRAAPGLVANRANRRLMVVQAALEGSAGQREAVAAVLALLPAGRSPAISRATATSY